MNLKWVIGAVIALAVGLAMAIPAGATPGGNQNENDCQYGSFTVKDKFIPGYWTYKNIEVKDYYVQPEYKTEYKVKELVKEAKGYWEFEFKKKTNNKWQYNWYKEGNFPNHNSGWQKTGEKRFVETKPAEYKFYWTFNPGQHEVVDQREVKVKDGYWVYKTVQVKDEYIPGYWTYKTVCKTADCSNPLYFDAHLDECDPLVEVCVDGEIDEYRTSAAPEDTGDCENIRVCIEGNFVSGTVFELNGKATHDCEPVRICLDGESQTVTEFQADRIDFDHLGSCVPQEDPPPTTETDPDPEVEVEVEEEIEEVVVAEVAPAVDEVAALPAAGQGPASTGVTYTWVAILGLVLIGLGSVTTVMVSTRK